MQDFLPQKPIPPISHPAGTVPAQVPGPDTPPLSGASPQTDSAPHRDVPSAGQLRLHVPEAATGAAAEAAASEEHRRREQAVSAEIVDNILKAAHRLRGLLTGHFSQFELSDIRFAVLRLLADSEPDGCTQADLATSLDQSESSISTLVKRMRKSELLYRLRSPFDRRKWVLKLTERGRGLLQSVECCHAERMCEILSGFDEREQEELAALMRKLIDELTPGDRDLRMTHLRGYPGCGSETDAPGSSSSAFGEQAAAAPDVPAA